MRLIDADKLEKDIVENITVKAVSRMLAIIQGQPTVKAIPLDKPFCKMVYGDYVCYNRKWLMKHLQMEIDILQGKAIPVDWIKRYASKKSYNDGMDCYWHFWEEDVLKMVADWEKENE